MLSTGEWLQYNIQEKIQTNDDKKYFPFFFSSNEIKFKKKNENEKNLTKFLKKIIASKHWKKNIVSL